MRVLHNAVMTHLKSFQRRVFAIFLLACMSINTLSAQPIISPLSTPLSSPLSSTNARPKVALVLSGGGARGLAHIGVLKVLEELQIPVDLVVGTSMGAVIGGAYAAGHSLSELEALANKTAWSDLLLYRAPREELLYRRRQEDHRVPSRIDMGLDKNGLVAPASTLGSTALEVMLRQVSARVSQVPNTSLLPVPFRAIATDLLTGEMQVLDGPSLFHVMRASMAVPGVFAPLEVEGKVLVDGGLVRNLPVDIARQLGAEIIIAVNVGTPLLQRDEVKSAIGVAQQMINILTEQNVRTSIGELRERDILITPDLAGIGFLDFSKPADAVARGELAARKLAESLQRYGKAPDFAAWLEKRTRTSGDAPTFEVGNVVIAGETRANKELLASRFGLKSGDKAEPAALEAGLTRVIGVGEFDRVNLTVVGSGAKRDIVLMPVESALAGNRVRLGLRLESDLRDTNSFSVMAQHTMPWVTSTGGEWNNFVQVGAKARLESEFYLPLSAGSRWFVAPSVAYEASQFDAYNAAQQRTARVGYSTAYAGIYGGYRLANLGEIRVGFGNFRFGAKPLIPEGGSASAVSGAGVSLELNIDTLDSATFPTSGYFVNLSATELRSAVAPVRTSELLAQKAWRLDNWALQAHAEFSRTTFGSAPNSLGGFLRLSGTPTQSLSGARTVLLRGVAARSIGQMPTGLGGAIRLGLSLEAGGASGSTQRLALSNFERAVTGFIAIDTRLGPIFVGAGHTFGRGSGVYVFLGRP
jgi:NTE family protein